MIAADKTCPTVTEWRHGWKALVAAFFGVGTSWTSFQILSGLFILPMQAEFGWSRSTIAIGPVAGLISMLFYLPAGMLIDRFGARRIGLVGLVLFSVGYMMLALVPADRIVFYAAVGFMAIVGALANSIVFARGLATWFKRRFGTAVGLMMTGVTVVSALAIPALSWIITNYGWRLGFWALAAMVILFGLPPVIGWFKLKEAPVALATRDVNDGYALSEALRDTRFWLLLLAFGLAALPIGAFLTHLQPLLRGAGYVSATAAAIGSIFVLSVGIGRVAVGTLLDRINPPFVAGGSLALSAVGAMILALAATNEAHFLFMALAVAMIGIAQGAESDYLSFFSLRVFGTKSFSRIVAIMSMVAGTGMAVGGIAFAALFDHFGNYELAIYLAAATYLASASVIAMIKVPSATNGLQVNTVAVHVAAPQ